MEHPEDFLETWILPDEPENLVECARCGKMLGLHEAVAEEGDEWECFKCNDRCNAFERGCHKELT